MAFLETTDGGRVYYEHFRGDGVPVVLIHGWGMSTQVWSPITDQLCTDGHEVIAIDHRGCGRSDRDFSDLSVSAIADDVIAIVRLLDLRPAVLNGWSLGGAVAVDAASRLGDRAAGLILTCGASPRLTRADDFPFGADADSYAGLGQAIGADRAGFFRALAGSVCARDIGEPMIEWMANIFLESAPRSYITLVEAATMDQRELLAGLSIPVLSCVGAKDTVIDPELGVQAGELAPHGQLARFEESGHAPFFDEPERYMSVIQQFLGSVQ